MHKLCTGIMTHKADAICTGALFVYALSLVEACGLYWWRKGLMCIGDLEKIHPVQPSDYSHPIHQP